MKKNKELIEELLLDLEEFEAYRDLQGEAFDFGTGLITNDSKISEDAIYKNKIKELKELLSSNVAPKKQEKKCRLNKHAKLRKKKIKMTKLLDYCTSGAVLRKDENGVRYVKKYYVSNRSKHAKKITNKIVRKSKNDFSLKGAGYKKKHDYWWEVW